MAEENNKGKIITVVILIVLLLSVGAGYLGNNGGSNGGGGGISALLFPPALQYSDGGANSGTIRQSDPAQNPINPVIPVRNRGNNINEGPINTQEGDSPAKNSTLLPPSGAQTRECREPHGRRTKYPLGSPKACQYTSLTTKVWNNADGVPFIDPNGKIYKCPKGFRRTFEPVTAAKSCSKGIFGPFAKAEFVDTQFAPSNVEGFSFTM